MDVKDLNKSQLILLALLLSFITSIATGITTVTLMQQAPSSVTVPINRIVRQTVEKIVPSLPGKDTVQTVIIKEEDLVVDAIAKNEASVFSITKDAQDEIGNIIEVSAGKGFVISNEGIIVTDSSSVYEGGTYFVKNSSGKFKASFVSSSKNGFSLIKIGAPIDEKNKISYTVPVFGDLSKMKIGQKILVLGSTISSFIFEGDKDIKINVTKSNGGAMVLNLDGEVLGIALSSDSNSFASIDSILESLKAKDVKVETKTP
ncbi:MAG: S1C family serine protease [Burkholderiales bacterium]|nr:S1C family serine protease [Burkholderiales bacterium]